MGEIELWNFQVPGADKAWTDAAEQYKKLRRPVPEVLGFYDHVIRSFKKATDRPIKKQTKKMVKKWRDKKKSYLAFRAHRRLTRAPPKPFIR